MLFAGLYESWQPKPDEWERTFTIVTTDANSVVAEVHDRMPVILPEEKADEWLHPREARPDTLRDIVLSLPRGQVGERYGSWGRFIR